MDSAVASPEPIDAIHRAAHSRGWRLLQPFRFADSDDDHIRYLLNIAAFPDGAHVLDVGGGVGECSRLMQAQRPDLRFTVLNFSKEQLADCPDSLDRILADAHALPFDTESFDAVMFNAALGNMDVKVALAEACRVLKVGGTLFLNELELQRGDTAALEAFACFRAYDFKALTGFAEAMGAEVVAVNRPRAVRQYLREECGDSASYDTAFDGIAPILCRFTKTATTYESTLGQLFGRRSRVAFQFSGGKDSLATLALLMPWIDRLCVYWLNPGNPFPETLELMEQVKQFVPHFKEIAGRQKQVVAEFGWPSDVVPVRWTHEGQFVFGKKDFMVQGRLDCCFKSLMQPMHDAMVADGVDCIIRGKRAEERDKSPTRSGDVVGGIELVYPLWDWTEGEVLDLLDATGFQLPESYKTAGHSLDCMDCTAWWGEGLSRFLAAKYPDPHAEYVRRVTLIKAAVAEELTNCEV